MATQTRDEAFEGGLDTLVAMLADEADGPEHCAAKLAHRRAGGSTSARAGESATIGRFVTAVAMLKWCFALLARTVLQSPRIKPRDPESPRRHA